LLQQGIAIVVLLLEGRAYHKKTLKFVLDPICWLSFIFPDLSDEGTVRWRIRPTLLAQGMAKRGAIGKKLERDRRRIGVNSMPRKGGKK
jgi:hypothetical protein